MPDPTNPADLPASWLPGASEGNPKPAGYRRAVARKIKNDRHAKVLAMATVAEDKLREVGLGAEVLEGFDEVLEGFDTRWWLKLAAAAGHPCRKLNPVTRAAVIEKVTRDMAEPYRAKGRG